MNALVSTTLIALAVIAATTVGLVHGDLSETAFTTLVGGFGGGAGVLHIAGARKR